MNKMLLKEKNVEKEKEIKSYLSQIWVRFKSDLD